MREQEKLRNLFRIRQGGTRTADYEQDYDYDYERGYDPENLDQGG